jgi:hypothetical protein
VLFMRLRAVGESRGSAFVGRAHPDSRSGRGSACWVGARGPIASSHPECLWKNAQSRAIQAPQTRSATHRRASVTATPSRVDALLIAATASRRHYECARRHSGDTVRGRAFHSHPFRSGVTQALDAGYAGRAEGTLATEGVQIRYRRRTRCEKNHEDGRIENRQRCDGNCRSERSRAIARYPKDRQRQRCGFRRPESA